MTQTAEQKLATYQKALEEIYDIACLAYFYTGNRKMQEISNIIDIAMPDEEENDTETN